MARFFREDFDRDRTFVVARGFTYEGQKYFPGGSIDKTLFSVRSLRQLYDARYLGYAEPYVIHDNISRGDEFSTFTLPINEPKIIPRRRTTTGIKIYDPRLNTNPTPSVIPRRRSVA